MSQFDELPEGWVGTDLKDIGICKTSKITPSDFPEELFEVWSVPALEIGRPEIIKGHEIGSSKQIVYENDVLLCKINPRLNRVWKVSKKDKLRQIASTEWVVFRVPSNCPDYLVHFFKEQKFRSLLCADITGVGGSLTRARPQEIQRLNIVLPPLNEQRRIVEKIEALTARSRKARAALDEIPALLDQFRQSVLAAAFRGDLTADWRAQNPNIESAEVLLERIGVERHKRWEASRKSQIESSLKYKTPLELDIGKLPDLPDSWTWGSLDQLLFSLRNGLSRKPADEMPGIPILRISALRPMALNINDVRYYQPINGENVDSYLLEGGDLLFTRYNGNRDFVGVCGSVKKLTGQLLHPDKLIRGKPVSSHLFDPSFLEIACNSGISRRFIDGCVKTSAGQHGISGSDLKRTPIPIPPIDEQYAIMALANKQFGIIDNLQTLIENKFDEFQVFDQAILAKAFRGELVPQDPNDEPAAVLLDRIRAEREKMAGHKKGKKMNRE